jgi:hypothetical protein
VIQKFLPERGLRLSEEKTVITHIRDGFDFFGKTVRKFGTQLIVQPSKAAAKSTREKIRALLRASRSTSYDVLLSKLNRLLRGWGNYHLYVANSQAGWQQRFLLWRMTLPSLCDDERSSRLARAPFGPAGNFAGHPRNQSCRCRKPNLEAAAPGDTAVPTSGT